MNQFSLINQSASATPFDNTQNGFTSTETQATIDELSHNLLYRTRMSYGLLSNFNSNDYDGVDCGVLPIIETRFRSDMGVL